MLPCIVITAYLLCGCWTIHPVQSQEIVPIVKHHLPQKRLVSVFGSQTNGSCSNISSVDNCVGTSVLNDHHIPPLSRVNSNQASSWAKQLFTLERPSGTGRIVVAFEVENANHDRMELAVFNCPEMNISLPEVSVSFDSSFRPDRPQGERDSRTELIIEQLSLLVTSCEHLLVFCLKYPPAPAPTPKCFINLDIPQVSSSADSRYVFLGEVTFRSGGSEPCDPAMPHPVAMDIITMRSVSTSSGTNEDRATNSPSTDVVVPVVVVLPLVSAIVAVIVITLVVIMCLKTRKRKYDSDKVQRLQNVVLETKENEKEAESYMDDQYAVVDAPPRNGVKMTAITDALYSNPDEAIDDGSYSRLRDGQKKNIMPQSETAIEENYSKLNRSQTDPGVFQTRKHSQKQEKPTDEGLLYAVPDKKKKNTSKKAPAVPEKSSELVEYLDAKEAGIVSGSGVELPEYSEIGAGDNRLSTHGSVGPVPLSNSGFVSTGNLDSNPIYQPTDVMPGQLATSPLHARDGLLEMDAIYSEPLPPSELEPEWDSDQNIYEAIYSEPLKPSLFMRDGEEIYSEDLRPYTSIYSAPIIPVAAEKPLLVTHRNIKVIRSLGNGNFGEVVLAQTVGLTPGQLRLEGDALHTLVAVKMLKENASQRNKQLFEKEVKFMSRLDHPNVIRLLGVCMDEEAPFLMMEYMTNGDLNQYLKGFNMHSTGHEVYGNIKPIETSTLIYMCTQIANAMHYLASQNFIHRDLATRNCLVGTMNIVKVADFGMSRSLYESQYYVISGHAILPIRWMATECFYGKFSAKTDVWAFGVTMWEIFMLGKEQPYDQLQDREVVEDAIKGPDRMVLERPRNCPEDIYEVMRKCWQYEPSERSTFDELYAMLFRMSQ